MIDTAEKRRSVSGLYTGFHPVSVTPNIAKDVEWRQQAGWGYSGIYPDGTTPPTPSNSNYRPIYRPRRRG